VWSGTAATTNLGASLLFSFSGLGSDTAAFQNKRADATPDFIALRATLDHTRTVWRGMEVSAHLSGQFTPQPLIENEQFSLGGLDSVRGYQEGAVLGDYGASAQAEIRSPAWEKRIAGGPGEVRLFAFFDAGAAGIDNALPGQTHSYSLSSTGLGLRARVFDGFTGEVLGAYPFAGASGTRAGNPRVLFRISAGL
jgi:hemolysin activation/secretion protein